MVSFAQHWICCLQEARGPSMQPPGSSTAKQDWGPLGEEGQGHSDKVVGSFHGADEAGELQRRGGTQLEGDTYPDTLLPPVPCPLHQMVVKKGTRQVTLSSREGPAQWGPTP